MEDLNFISSTLKSKLENHGIEVHFFKVQWYNENVDNIFNLDYPKNTLSCVILTKPDFFEKAFIPYVKSNKICTPNKKDLIDNCIKIHINRALNDLQAYGPVCMYDYELLPNRRPKVLVQTAAHISGAAFYYQQKHLQADYQGKKLFGVCVHPQYGGWFAIRSVVVFTKLQCPELPFKPPKDCLPTEEQRLDVLKKFNTNWKDASYRNCIPVSSKYSNLQRKYFETPPKERAALLDEIFNLQV